MVFITAGMGGAQAPVLLSVVAEIAKASGALTIAVVTKPFGLKGAHRNEKCRRGYCPVSTFSRYFNYYPERSAVHSVATRRPASDAAFRLADEV